MRRGIRVYCRVCKREKLPRGRSAPIGMYGCSDPCHGYRMGPLPGDLWPGETDEDFGYPVSVNATELIEEPSNAE